jgi:hypothetical protein
MVDRGNVDKCRRSIPGLGKVQNAETWGRDQARQRYGSLDYFSKAPPAAKDQTRQQDPAGKWGPGYQNNHANDRVRGAGESGEGKPGFDHSKGKR